MGKFNLKVLLLLSAGHMVVDIYQGALPTVLPFLKDRLGLSYTMAGVILIMANLTSSIIQPLFGFLSDKKEKGFLLPLGTFLAGTGFALLATTSSFAMILLLVTISGLGIASYHPEGFKTASFFTGPRKATGMSVFSVGGNTGMAFGPILALSIINYRGFDSLPVIAVPALAFTATILVLRKQVALPEGAGAAVRAAAGKTVDHAYRWLTLLISVIVMRTWTQIGFISYISFYYINYLKGDPVFAGKLVSLFLLGGAAGTLLGAPLADRWGHRFWLRFTMLASGCIFPLIFFVEGWLLFVTVTVMGMILISTFSVTVVIGQRLLPRNLGVASGLIVGFAIGTGGIGVTLLGVVADHFGVPAALKTIGILPFVGFLLAMFLKYPEE
jgi:FSR family fosmidomycin resistance protein-like MFS transporter